MALAAHDRLACFLRVAGGVRELQLIRILGYDAIWVDGSDEGWKSKDGDFCQAQVTGKEGIAWDDRCPRPSRSEEWHGVVTRYRCPHELLKGRPYLHRIPNVAVPEGAGERTEAMTIVYACHGRLSPTQLSWTWLRYSAHIHDLPCY